MRKIIFFVAFISVLASCSQDFLIPDKEVPHWLQEQIAEDEAIINSDPKLMPNYGAWIRYEFKGNWYYEYDNPLSSLSRNPYSENGIRIDTQEQQFIDYWTDKCCETFIWKAPGYNEN